MKLAELLSGRPDFASESQIIEYVRNSKNFDPSSEDLAGAEALLIFSTSNQHTWLVSTAERLYCILDDIRKDEPHVNWSRPKNKLLQGKQVVAEIKLEDRTPRTGAIQIADISRPWLYTKRLFSEDSIENRVKSLLKKTMT